MSSSSQLSSSSQMSDFDLAAYALATAKSGGVLPTSSPKLTSIKTIQPIPTVITPQMNSKTNLIIPERVIPVERLTTPDFEDLSINLTTSPEIKPRSSYSEVMKSSIDDILLSKDYIILNNYITEDGKIYVKTRNIAGDITLIEVAEPSKYLTNSSKYQKITTKKMGTIDKTIVLKSSSCANDVCGVAFITDEEMCVYKKGNTGDEIMISYSLPERILTEESLKLGSPLSHPIVTIEEVLANDELCLKYVRSATVNIQNNAIKEISCQSQSIIHTAMENCKLISSIVCKLQQIHDFRMQSHMSFLKVFTDLRRKIINDVASADDIETFNNLSNYLYRSNLECERLINASNIICNINEPVSLLNYELNSNYWLLFLELKNQDKFPLASKKDANGNFIYPIVRHDTWDLPAEVDKLSFNDIMSGKLSQIQQTENVKKLRSIVDNLPSIR